LKKILFISLAVVLALSVGLIGCEGEGEEPDVWDSEILLTIHPTISPFASIVGEVINPWVDEVNALTGTDGGSFNLTIVSPGDAPFDAASSLSALSIGTTDMGMLSPETFHLGGIGYLPFEFDSIEECAYVTYNLWTEDDGVWDVDGQMNGVKILLSTPLWGSQLWTTLIGGNVTVAADMAGLKIRSDAQNVESATIQALGATAVNIGVSELSGQLETDAIDGCFFTYSGIGGAADLGGVTNYTTELNMIYRPYSIAMWKAKWDALPTDAKTALETVCGAEKSMEYATLHLAGEEADRDDTIDGPCAYSGPPFPCNDRNTDYGRPIYVADTSTFEAATASVASDWAAYMTDTLEFDGAGILARIAELQVAFAAL